MEEITLPIVEEGQLPRDLYEELGYAWEAILNSDMRNQIELAGVDFESYIERLKSEIEQYMSGESNSEF